MAKIYEPCLKCSILLICPLQGGDSDDDVEGFVGSDDKQPSGDSIPAPSQDPEGVSTYGEDDLVPEPHRVREREIVFVHIIMFSF